MSAAIGDLTGDGRPDLAVADLQSDPVSILINLGGVPSGVGRDAWTGAGVAAPAPTVLPNPAAGSVAIHFELPATATARIEACDVSGRIVRRLAGGSMAAGRHVVTWDGRDEAGRPVASGVYRIRLVGQQEIGSTAFVVLR